MKKHACAWILLAAAVGAAPAQAQTSEAPTAAAAPMPKVAPKQQVGLPAPRAAPKRGPALKTFDLATAGKKGTQTASVEKAGPAVPPPPRIKVPRTKAPQAQTAERKKAPRVNAAKMIASTVRSETRN